MRIDNLPPFGKIDPTLKIYLTKIIRFWNDHNDGTRVWDTVPSANFLGSGSLTSQTITKTSTYTVTVADTVIFVDSTAGAFTVTLLAAATVKGRVIVVTMTAGNNIVTVNTAGGNINGAASVALPGQYFTFRFISDGTNYFLI